MKKIKILILTLGIGGILGVAIVAFAAMTARDFTGCNEYGCTYKIVWDGWEGFLTLAPPAGGAGTGTGYLEQRGRDRCSVRYQILCDPQDSIGGSRGPGYIGTRSSIKHRIVFWVDFNNTPNNPRDDQRFDGYMMTQTKNAIAGITWWNKIPFGFYATNKQSPLI